MTLMARLICSGTLVMLGTSISLSGSPECSCVDFSSDAYGFGCRSHDFNGTEEPDCAESAKPEWCSDKWCYVNASTCQVTYERSVDYPGLGWSYTTCGYRDLYSRENITQSLKGKTLRVVYLGNTGGWKGNYCQDAAGQICEKQRGSGPVQRFFDLLAGSKGFAIEQVKEMPQAAYDQMMRVRPQGSQFDLCTWATGMGFVDVCVSSIVVLPRRADATPFVTLWAEPTILVGPLVEQRSEETLTVAYMLSAAFRPFSPGLWLAMLSVVISTSLMITYFETAEGGQFTELHRKRDRLGEAVYRAFYSLCMCESRFEPTTLGGRIVGLGLAFLLILLVCGYTATLASFLVVEKRVAPEIDSLDDAIRRNFKICAHISHVQTLRAGGMAEENIVVIRSRTDVLTSIGGVCDVGAMSSEDFEAAQALNRGSFCNLERIGLPIGSIMVGMPTSEKWAKQLRYAVTEMSMDGHLQQSLTQYRPQDYCTSLQTDTGNAPEALTLEGMLGPFLVTLFLAMLGIVAHVLRMAARKTRKAAHELGIDEKVHRVSSKIKKNLSRTSRASSEGSFTPNPNQNMSNVSIATPKKGLPRANSARSNDLDSHASLATSADTLGLASPGRLTPGTPGNHMAALEEVNTPRSSVNEERTPRGTSPHAPMPIITKLLEHHEANVMSKLENIERFLATIVADESVAEHY